MIQLFSLLTDFGLVILIWMTQLVVYPGFTYFSPDDLVAWHQKYTTQISIIVMPLMLAQVLLHVLGIYQNFTIWKTISILIIILMWVNTFLYAVPLHNKIAQNEAVIESAKALVKVNWFRTIGWSLVFVIGLYELIKTHKLFG